MWGIIRSDTVLEVEFVGLITVIGVFGVVKCWGGFCGNKLC